MITNKRQYYTGIKVLLFIFLTLTITGWGWAALIQSWTSSSSITILISLIQYLSIVLVPVIWVALVIGDDRPLTVLDLVLLHAGPIGITILAWLSGSLQNSIDPSGDMTSAYRALFWIRVVYSCGLTLFGTFVLVRRHLRVQDWSLKHSIELILSISIVWVSNALCLLAIRSVPPFDFAAFSVGISGFLLGWKLYHYELPEIDQFDTLSSSLIDPALVISADDRIIAINSAALHLLNLKSDEILGWPATNLPNELETNWNHGRSYNGPQKEIAVGNGPLAQKFTLTTSHIRNRNLSDIARLVVFHTIPAYRQRMEHLEVQNVVLAKHIQNRSVQAIAAEEISRLKNQFVATISHELRTPLTVIQGFTELLLVGVDGPLTDKQQNALLRVSSNAEHLLYLINQILDLAKMEAGEFELDKEPFEVAIWLKAIIVQARELADKKGLNFEIEFDYQMPSQIIGDPARYKQIILNLASNAVKFTEDGFVKLRILKSGPEQWMIKVSDSGIGIPLYARKVIFEEFQQVDAGIHRPSPDGIGLGLAIVHNLVDLMGGSVVMESELRKGSTFTVTLPLVTVNGKHSDEVLVPIGLELP